MSGVLRFDQLDSTRQGAIRKNLATLQQKGASESDIEAYLRDDEKIAPATEPFAGPPQGAGRDWTDEPGKVASALSGAVDATSMGFADEIGSLAPAAANLIFGDVAGAKKAFTNRRLLQGQLRQRDEEARSANPKSYFGGELAAGIAAAPKALAKLGIAKGGAAVGAAMGAGHAEGNLTDRAIGAGVGAAGGALVGKGVEKVVAPAVGYLASKAAPYVRPVVDQVAPVLKNLANRVGAGLEERGVGLSTRDVSGASQPPNASRAASPVLGILNRAQEVADAYAPLSSRERAQQLLLKNLGRDETSVGNLIADAQQLAPDSPMSVIDLADRNTMGAARGAAAVPSKAKTQIPKALNERAKLEHGRARTAIESAAGTEAGDPELVTAELVKRTRENAKPVYEKAYANPPIEDPDVLALFKDEVFQDAYETAKRIAERDGVTLPASLTRDVTIDGVRGTEQVPIPVQGFDYVKQSLDDVIEKRMNSGKMGRKEARQLRDMLGGALKKVDEIAPDYKAARAQFAGDKEMEAAAEAGQEFLTTDDRKVARLVQDYTPGEREVYAQMALNAVDKALRSTGDTHDVYNRIFGNQLKRDALKALVGEDAFRGLQQEMEAIQRRGRSLRFVTSGSNTVPQLGEQLDMETTGIPTALLQLIKGNPGKAAQSLGSSVLMNRMKGITGETADELGQMTTAGMQGGEAGRASFLDILTELRQAEENELKRRLTRQAIAPVTRPFSGATGAATSPRNERR